MELINTMTMSTSQCGLAFVLVMVLIDVSLGIICFECNDVVSAKECQTVSHCGSNEVCYNERYINKNGHVYRRMGCRDRKSCPGAIFGRRKRADGDITICERCCDTDFCQTKICDDIDYAADRGHLCYNCDVQTGGGTCDKIKECSRDEVCYESRSGYVSTQSYTRTTGCMSRSSCQQVMADLQKQNFTSSNYTEEWTDGNGVHRQQTKCFACCDKDVCNTQCVVEVACRDTQDLAVCQLAKQFVCHDRTKATNAGCLQTCGLCP